MSANDVIASVANGHAYADHVAEFSEFFNSPLGDFYDAPRFLEKLAAMAVEIANDDQDYVPGYLLEQMNLDDGYKSLKTYMRKYFEADDAPQENRDEGNRIFQEIPDTTTFVLSNVEIAPLALETSSPTFQDFFLKLRELAKENSDFAKAIMFYGVAMALFEWRDRQRSVPYDPEIHDPITLATTLPKKPK